MIGVRRWWVQPWRETNCQGAAPYYDLTIMELGKINYLGIDDKKCWNVYNEFLKYAFLIISREKG